MVRALHRPVKTPLTSDGLVAFAACTTLSATKVFHSINTAGVFGVHSTFFVPDDLDLDTQTCRSEGPNTSSM